jgi:regulatory protein
LDGQEGSQPSAGEMRAWAYRLLGRREYSVAELRQRLQLKWPGLEPGVADDLLDALVAENLLSDERFTESFVRSHIQRQQGPLKIRAGLRAKGVADALIARELERQAGAGAHAWAELAAQWLERQHPGPLDYDTRGKFYRRLLNRGFTHDQAMDAIGRSG